MAEIDALLAEVERLISVVKPQEAEERLRSLLSTIGDSELLVWEADLRLTIDQFLPKRRRGLTEALNQRLGKASGPEEDALPSPRDNIDLQQLGDAFALHLQDLRDQHIFQWSTFYRDWMSFFFDEFLDAARQSGSLTNVLAMMRPKLTQHAKDIFQHGFNYQMRHSRQRPHAIAKSVNGLQKFIDLPIEFYSTKLQSTLDASHSRMLRSLCSGMLGSILKGYSSASFDWQTGADVLNRYTRAWAHTLPFLTGTDLASLLADLEPGELKNGILNSVGPFVQALDELAERATYYVPLPALAQLVWHVRRLDTSLRPPPYAAEPKLIEAQCYLDPAFVSRGALEEAAHRGVGLIIAPLRPDLHKVVGSHERLNRVVVQADVSTAPQRATSALELTIYQRRSPRAGAQPLTYNFAKEFPLQIPSLTRYFHVYRSSVRDLLRTFERRNGVRLWCSVRRSGKTTACLDLGTTTGRSSVVSQTCDSTGLLPGNSLFYDQVSEALAAGKQLTNSFLSEAIARSASGRSSEDGRVVFVLDEYETLFGRLSGALRREPYLRYTVVQPLLNQMVRFSEENLLVFMGQQPNAHFIMMDQNQLSALVQQDSFPLFYHAPSRMDGEFGDLVQKVLTSQVSFDIGFLNAVYFETAGHPYLTVNLLTQFVDWLIEKRRRIAELALTEDDFIGFADKKLRRSKISISPEYAFFREAIAEATSLLGKEQTPWLYAIYSCLRAIVVSSPETLLCSRSDFEAMVSKLGLEDIGLNADHVLSTGSQANFLQYDDHNVWPKIRLLGRLAMTARSRVRA